MPNNYSNRSANVGDVIIFEDGDIYLVTTDDHAIVLLAPCDTRITGQAEGGAVSELLETEMEMTIVPFREAYKLSIRTN